MPADASFPWKRLLGDLAITAGPYRGAYRILPDGGINWYFSNVALWFFAPHMPDAVRRYLDTYIALKNPVDQTIADVSPDLSVTIPPDSHDAYAGTLLRLAVRYWRVTGDSAWWGSALADLKAVAFLNILRQIKPNGLVRSFQAPHPNDTSYLMDQCEVYAGLRDFGEILIQTNDAHAPYFSGFAINLGKAIHTLYEPDRNLWRWCDVTSASADRWYPDLVAQLFPHLYDVHGSDAPSDYDRLQRGYEVLNAKSSLWWQRPQDVYPWLLVAYYAALRRNEIARALACVSMAQHYYLPGHMNTGHYPICDLGFALGTIELANSQMKSECQIAL